jgi:hypothetical protein
MSMSRLTFKEPEKQKSKHNGQGAGGGLKGRNVWQVLRLKKQEEVRVSGGRREYLSNSGSFPEEEWPTVGLFFTAGWEMRKAGYLGTKNKTVGQIILERATNHAGWKDAPQAETLP